MIRIRFLGPGELIQNGLGTEQYMRSDVFDQGVFAYGYGIESGAGRAAVRRLHIRARSPEPDSGENRDLHSMEVWQAAPLYGLCSPPSCNSQSKCTQCPSQNALRPFPCVVSENMCGGAFVGVSWEEKLSKPLHCTLPWKWQIPPLSAVVR